MASENWLTDDFYKALGVSEDASESDIKKAYRKLSRKYHPDLNPGDAAAEKKFKEISEAYDVLSDKKQREEYDQIRRYGAAGMGGFGGGGFGGGSYTGYPGADAFGGFSNGGAGINIDDLLGGLFGGSAGGSRRSAGFTSADFGGMGGGGFSSSGFGGAQHAAPEESTTSTRISLAQAYTGATVTVFLPDGSHTEARIPAGIKDGQKVRVKGHGKPGMHGGPVGDLEVAVTVKPHPVYSREGNDLVMTLPVTVSEAILGATIDVPMIDGNTATVKVPAGSSSGAEIRVRGEGVKTSKATGDLIARLSIQVPEKPSRELKKLVKDMAKAEGDLDVRASLAKAAEE